MDPFFSHEPKLFSFLG